MTGAYVSNWAAALHWGFGEGFWYADPLQEVREMTEEQLLWSPMPKVRCPLWHLGHIAHRERFHIGHLLQDKREGLIPTQFEVFGVDVECLPGDALRQAVGSVQSVKQWVREVRRQSHEYIDSLGEEDFHRVPNSSFEGNSVAKVLIQTIGHTGVHIGRIQLLRKMMENGDRRNGS